MIDREKVINGLECCAFYFHERQCRKCPYYSDYQDCRSLLIQNAKEILKAQQPKPPVITENAYGWKFYHCPKCGREFYTDRLHGRVNAMKFCDKCGQAVKWDG